MAVKTYLQLYKSQPHYINYNIIISSTTKSSKVVGSTFVVPLLELDKDNTTVSFALSKDNEQFCFLNTVSTSLIRQSCEPNNDLVNLPKCISKTINFSKYSHSNTKCNRDCKAPLYCLKFFELLNRNSNDNAFVFVLEKLDKDTLKHQFDDHNVTFNCHIRDVELGKILTPNVEDLSMFVKANFKSYNTRLENRLACNICHSYKLQDTEKGYTPDCRPFDCYHYYHG